MEIRIDSIIINGTAYTPVKVDYPYTLNTPDYPDIHGRRCRIAGKEADPGVCGESALYTVYLEGGGTWSAFADELIKK